MKILTDQDEIETAEDNALFLATEIAEILATLPTKELIATQSKCADVMMSRFVKIRAQLCHR